MLSRPFARFVAAVLAAACMAHALSGENTLDFKYMYYWDRNGVWNHTPAFAFLKNLTDRWSFTWQQELDAVSGASRRLGLKEIGTLGDNTLNLDAVSGASRQEFRHSEQPGVAYAKGPNQASANFYFSDESDYRSYSPSFSLSHDWNERNTTLSGSAALFFDDFHPRGPFSHLGGARNITATTVSVAQIVSPTSLAGVTLNYVRSTGFLGHPYNPVITGDGAMFVENLPDLKNAFAATGQWIQGFHLGQKLGSLHAEYRWYLDDWELKSHTVDFQWYQYATETLYFRARARGYAQTAAAFFKDSYVGDELYRTSDIRYSKFSSITLGLKCGGVFPESWNRSAALPDRWDIGYDQGIWDVRGDENGSAPHYHYQFYGHDERYLEGTLMVGLGFDL